MELKGIKNIIFDLGGVIININPSLAMKAFRELFQNAYNDVEKELHTKNILDKFEVGAITSTDFISFFQSHKSTLSSEKIMNAWNSMLLNIPVERLKMIDILSSQYRVFLLSNTNEIHVNFINNYVKEVFKMGSMALPFEKAYYSHEMGLRKPNPQIFKTILGDATLLPEETLFIDDSEEHIISAKQLNLKTHHLKSPETIVTIFS